MAAVGLAQNFAALRALATEGIQTGPHDAARAQRREGGRRRPPSSSTRCSSGSCASGEIKVWKAQEIVERAQAGAQQPGRGGQIGSRRRGAGRRLRQGDPARRARGRLRPPRASRCRCRSRSRAVVDDAGERRGAPHTALGRRVPAREAARAAPLLRARGRRHPRPARAHRARHPHRGVPRRAPRDGTRRIRRHGGGHHPRPRPALRPEAHRRTGERARLSRRRKSHTASRAGSTTRSRPTASRSSTAVARRRSSSRSTSVSRCSS